MHTQKNLNKSGEKILSSKQVILEHWNLKNFCFLWHFNCKIVFVSQFWPSICFFSLICLSFFVCIPWLNFEFIFRTCNEHGSVTALQYLKFYCLMKSWTIRILIQDIINPQLSRYNSKNSWNSVLYRMNLQQICLHLLT